MSKRCLFEVLFGAAVLAFCVQAWATSPPPAAGYGMPSDEKPADEMPVEQTGGEQAPAGGDQDDDGEEAGELNELVPDAVQQPTPEQARALIAWQLHLHEEKLARPAASVIEALANRSQLKEQPAPAAKGVDEATATAAEAMRNFQRYQRQVATGNWPGVKSYLAQFPPQIGSAIYKHLLDLLTAGTQVVLLPQEIVPLADAAPGPLTAAQAKSLGILLARSTAKLGLPHLLLRQIKAGTDRLGGDEPAQRVAAARTLLAANLLDQARDYLPPLDEALRTGDATTLNLIARYQQRRYEASADTAARDISWQVTRAVLAKDKLKPRQRSAAVRRALGLMPLVSGDDVARWLGELFNRQPDLGMFLLAGLAEQVEAVSQAPAAEARLKALTLEQQVVGALLASCDDDLARWSVPLDMLLSDWLVEGERTLASPTAANAVQSWQNGRHHRSNVYYHQGYPVSVQSMIVQSNSNDSAQSLPTEKLLPLCPDENWCRSVSPELAYRVRELFAHFAARTADREKLLAGIARLDGADSDTLRQLGQEYLGAWGRKLQSTEEVSGASYLGMAGAIPLTRAKQARNLAQFREMVAWLESLSLPQLDSDAVVTAFDACYSPAEVYREDDLREAFSDLDALAPELALQLAGRMRGKLSGQWRNVDLQNAGGTRRTDRQVVAEITRGYELAERLAEAAIAHPDLEHKLEPRLAVAALDFDRAEFLYGQNADLKTYTRLRDRAFSRYREAADLYAASLNLPGVKTASIDVYRQWFYAALGASDLAFLTRESKPDRDQIAEIAAALGRLPPDSRERHLELFCRSLTETQPSLPPAFKPRYLREALRIVGDYPGGRQARRQLDYYDDLLQEVQLQLAVDGSSQVGKRPFGVFLSIRSTAGLMPENGGFSHLLQNTAMNSFGGEVNYRQQLESELREKLAEGFEVEQIIFHDPNVQPRGFGRAGWLETPLAYLVLRAKRPEVDRLPAVQLDLSFADGGGIVLLPIASQVELIDARGIGQVRPMHGLQVKQVLDDRGDGQLKLQVNAVAKGLLPDLAALVDVGEQSVAGFRLKDVQDVGMEVTSLESSESLLEPVCQRDWLLTFEPLADSEVREFAFPAVKSPGAEVRYARYDDADVVDVSAVAPLRRPLFSRSAGRWVAFVVVLCALFAALVAAIRVALRRMHTAPSADRYRAPERLTPFSAVMLLKRMSRDDDLRLSDDERTSLHEAIEQLEHDYFDRNGQPPRRELEGVLDRWLSLAHNGHATSSHAGRRGRA